MKTIKTLGVALFISGVFYGQTETPQETEANNKDSSQEIVTKIIRIKGPNGEEKVIKQQEVITKAGKIKFNPEDGDKMDKTAVYEDAEVSVQKSGSTSSSIEGYSKQADGKGFIITLSDPNGSTVTKVRPLDKGYYLVHLGKNSTAVGQFDEKNNFIVQTYDSSTDQIVKKSYKLLK